MWEREFVFSICMSFARMPYLWYMLLLRNVARQLDWVGTASILHEKIIKQFYFLGRVRSCAATSLDSIVEIIIFRAECSRMVEKFRGAVIYSPKVQSWSGKQFFWHFVWTEFYAKLKCVPKTKANKTIARCCNRIAFAALHLSTM